jgi:transposase InsO family protein
MASLTYRQLRRQTRAWGGGIRATASAHKKTAAVQAAEAKDTGRVAEQIATLKVDEATVAETREVAKIMQGISTVALSYANAADEAERAAAAAEQQAAADHGGIQQAVDSSPVRMAKSNWYTQE